MALLIPTEISIHHGAENDTPDVQWGGIRKWHMGIPPNGPADGPYRDIGYHAGCELVGDHHEILIGRMWNETGAHTLYHNGTALGLCFVGNFMLVPPPAAQLIVGAKLVRYWMWLFGIPIEKVFRHKDLNPGLTECPGAAFPWERFLELCR